VSARTARDSRNILITRNFFWVLLLAAPARTLKKSVSSGYHAPNWLESDIRWGRNNGHGGVEPGHACGWATGKGRIRVYHAIDTSTSELAVPLLRGQCGGVWNIRATYRIIPRDKQNILTMLAGRAEVELRMPRLFAGCAHKRRRSCAE